MCVGPAEGCIPKFFNFEPSESGFEDIQFQGPSNCGITDRFIGY